MYARISKFRMKKDKVESAKALIQQLKPQIMSLPGLKSFVNAMNEDGNGYVIAVVDSEETSNANKEKVEAIWAQFADHLAEPPTVEGYSVLICETKA